MRASSQPREGRHNCRKEHQEASQSPSGAPYSAGGAEFRFVTWFTRACYNHEFSTKIHWLFACSAVPTKFWTITVTGHFKTSQPGSNQNGHSEVLYPYQISCREQGAFEFLPTCWRSSFSELYE